MAHYAVLDENNIVEYVFVGKDEEEDDIDWEKHYSEVFNGKKVKRTSYNTYGNQHNNSGVAFRKNYAGLGMSYDENLDAFIPQKQFDSWILNEETGLWEPPIQKPNDENDYFWDESSISWVKLEITT